MRISDLSSDVCFSDLLRNLSNASQFFDRCGRVPDRRETVMIVAFLNQQGGVGKTTLALHLAGEWARCGQRVTLIDADPQGSALDWSNNAAGRDWSGCSALSAWRATRSTVKRRSWRATSITSSSTGRRVSPA